MTISTAVELRTSIASWLHRTDLTAVIPDFIALAEARFNRVLRVRGMEEALAATTLASGAVTLPTGFLAFKELRYDGSPSYTLRPTTLEWIRNQPADAGRPGHFAVTNTQVVCWPTAGDIKGTYYKAVPALASNAANWLLTSHPDVYLFAALEEAAVYVQDEPRMQLWGSKASALLGIIQSADNANSINGGPLTARAR